MSLRDAGITLMDCVHKTPPDIGVGYPYIAIPQMQGGRMDLSGARRVSEEHYKEWTKKALPQAWDVMLSRRCNPGESVFVPPGFEGVVGQNLVLLRSDGTSVIPEFLRWLVRSPEWWEQVQRHINVGAIFESLTCKDIPNFPLHIPPKEDQLNITEILGALDDKIELNWRMNGTLEAMAQALFKEWFVSRPSPGGAKDEWEELTIGDLADVVGGSTPSTKEDSYWNGKHCWATPKDLSSLQVPVLLDTDRHLTDAGLAEVGSGLLPIGTVLMSSRAPIGYIAIAEVRTAVNQGFIALKAKKGISNLFLWQWTKHAQDEIKSRANGSTFQEISKANFRPITVAVPPATRMEAFDKLVRPLYDRLVANEKESRILTALRDTLLPKLMRGEVRVKETEHNPT